MTKSEKIEALKQAKAALDELILFVAKEDADYSIYIHIHGKDKLHTLTNIDSWKKP